MKPAETKANRLRQIEALLIEHPDGLTQSELARRLGVHHSTIATPMDLHNLMRDFKETLSTAGLPAMRFHDLRHTAASLMMNHQVPIMVASRRLEHSRWLPR